MPQFWRATSGRGFMGSVIGQVRAGGDGNLVVQPGKLNMKSCESGDPDRVPRVQIRLGSGEITLHVKMATRLQGCVFACPGRNTTLCLDIGERIRLVESCASIKHRI
jgi:hypothetical protein